MASEVSATALDHHAWIPSLRWLDMEFVGAQGFPHSFGMSGADCYHDVLVSVNWMIFVKTCDIV
eukprot:4951468-Amphidinium_carterae.1